MATINCHCLTSLFSLLSSLLSLPSVAPWLRGSVVNIAL